MKILNIIMFGSAICLTLSKSDYDNINVHNHQFHQSTSNKHKFISNRVNLVYITY